MDIQGRTPQHGMRPHDNKPPQRPQGYTTPPARPSVDGFGPPPSAPQAPPNLQPQPANPDHMLPPGHQGPVADTAPQGPQVLEPTHDHNRSSKPVVLAIITLLIAAGLAVAAFFAFRPETAEKVNKVNVPTNTSEQSQTSTGDAIDDATVDINQQTEGQNDSQDFSDSELSDQTLGL